MLSTVGPAIFFMRPLRYYVNIGNQKKNRVTIPYQTSFYHSDFSNQHHEKKELHRSLLEKVPPR